MTRDQDLVKQLQRHLPDFRLPGFPEEKLRVGERCIYNQRGQLIELHLNDLWLTQVPPEVWQCSSLQTLDLGSNLRLSTLPAEIGQLTALQTLILDSNQFSTLPAAVCQLTTLRTLELGVNQLTALPAEMGQLTALQTLDLSVNQFSILPAAVCQLTALQTLILNNNNSGLGTLLLPAEIGQLTALRTLDWSGNQLSALPAEIGQLTALRTLNLERNQLSTLPAEMGQLTALRTLNLSGNWLSTLPAEMGQLTALQTLELNNNHHPLQSPPPAIVEQGTPAILAYLQAQLRAAVLSAAEQNTITSLPPRPIKIFYCYAHEDRDLRDRIDKHLGVLKRLGQVTGWYDREIQAGTDWKQEIEAHLSTASIILLLVSADFVHSDYCYGVEMRKALEMHKEGKAHVLPILLRPVDWEGAPFADLQFLPTGAKPITKWPDPEDALEDVARQIRAVVNSVRTRQG